MDFKLNDVETRILGCLMEKELATPEYYPLSLNALMNGCNQKSNRDPIVSFNEKTIEEGLGLLKEKNLAWQTNLGRVTKYGENLMKVRTLITEEAAIICVLLVRGPQTIGELRERTERLYKFENVEGVEKILQNLDHMGYVRKLVRQPGQKESRYAHLLSGEPIRFEDTTASQPGLVTQILSEDSERVSKLEEELKHLRQELETLKREFLDFKRQF